MDDYIISGQILTDIADSIRSADGSSAAVCPEEMAAKIKGCYDLGYRAAEDEIAEEAALQAELISQAAAGLNGKVDPELYDKGYDDGAALMRQRAELSLTAYSDEQLKTIGEYAFFGCRSLADVDAPNCTYIGNYAFQYCVALKEINFPSLTKLGEAYSYSFSRCTGLVKADFGCVESIGGYAFQLCSNLTTLIIRTPTVCTLQGVSAINSTAINSNKGYVYVPDNLVDSYKAATNWATFADQIKPLSELEG